MDSKVITITEEAFYELIGKVVTEVKKTLGEQAVAKWIDGSEAMQMLKISSPTTLQKLRDNGEIRYSQPMTKVILYDRDSILQYIEKHVREKF